MHAISVNRVNPRWHNYNHLARRPTLIGCDPRHENGANRFHIHHFRIWWWRNKLLKFWTGSLLEDRFVGALGWFGLLFYVWYLSLHLFVEVFGLGLSGSSLVLWVRCIDVVWGCTASQQDSRKIHRCRRRYVRFRSAKVKEVWVATNVTRLTELPKKMCRKNGKSIFALPHKVYCFLSFVSADIFIFSKCGRS